MADGYGNNVTRLIELLETEHARSLAPPKEVEELLREMEYALLEHGDGESEVYVYIEDCGEDGTGLVEQRWFTTTLGKFQALAAYVRGGSGA